MTDFPDNNKWNPYPYPFPVKAIIRSTLPATSFPGFSPTRPLSLHRAGRREPWEWGCPPGVNSSCSLTNNRSTRACHHNSFHSTLGFGTSFKHAFCSVHRGPYQLHIISWIPSWQRRGNVNDISAIFNSPSHVTKTKLPSHGTGLILYVSGKLPTYPSPKPTFCSKWEASFYVTLGEG